MNASTVKSNLRNRLIAIGVAIALIVGAVMAYPVFSDGPGNVRANNAVEAPAMAGPIFGPGGGGGGG